ncbi:MAG: C40 family peptidase [Oscillospiraceae bacterium]|nr:C40 family peptidase [Oscillospiraceae bacterium]
MTEFAIINVPVATVCEAPALTKDGRTLRSDEGLFGHVVRVLSETDGWAHILSHYGYAGYVRVNELLPADEAAARAWLASGLMVVDAGCLDVASAPTVHGAPIVSLPAGTLLRILPGEAEEGYIPVALPDGRTGFAAANRFEEKRFGEDYLWRDPAPILENLRHVAERRETETGGREDLDFSALLSRWYGGSEEAFRRTLVSTARKYLGVQYRWGGRSSFGLDCSGLVGVSYLRAGVNIYRDASLVRGYALRRLTLDWDEGGAFRLSNITDGALRPGDALYFKGHVAMYIGDGRYIHSTGRVGDLGVVINSLVPGEPDFRPDLPERLYAAGGLRRPGEY